MDTEVLIATMNLKNSKMLLEEMNIQTDAIICNQDMSVNTSYKTRKFRNNNVKIFSFQEKGVGLNRNNALMRANAKYCIIADDDLEFLNDYKETINKNFKKYPSADILAFNLLEDAPMHFETKKDFKVNRFNYMRFGAARLVVKRGSILKNNIFFNLNFGGGTDHGSGEDTLFLHECLTKGLKVMAVTDTIARLKNNRNSTWFDGYNKKYFEDKGALYAAISYKWSTILCLQFLIRHRKLFNNDLSLSLAYSYMKMGKQQYINFDK